MDIVDGYIQRDRNVAVGKQGKLINESDFQQFVLSSNEDRAIGYLQALNDFTAYAEVILGGGYCKDGIPETPHMISKYLRELVEHNGQFLKEHSKDFDLNFNR